MDAAILAASVLAAATGVIAVALSLWWRRTRLEIEFTDAWSASGTAIAFEARFENRGSVAIYQVDVFPIGPGDTFDRDRQGTLGHFALQPGESRVVSLPVPRPQRVDLSPGEVQPTFKCPVGVVALYGRRQRMVWLPASQSAPWPAVPEAI